MIACAHADSSPMIPDDPRTLLAAAFDCHAKGDARAASALADRAAACAPDEPAVLGAQAMLLAPLDPARAEVVARRLLDIDPGNAGAYGFLASLFADQTRDVEACALFERYATRDLPPDARRAVLAALASLRNRTGDAAGALAALDLLDPLQDRTLAHMHLLYALYASDLDDAGVMALKRRFDTLDPNPPRPARSIRPRSRPRIGFAGSNLDTLNYMALFAPLLEELDRSRFDFELIALKPVHSFMAAWYEARGFALVAAHDVGRDPDALAARIAARDLDLLVELDDVLTSVGRPLVRRRPARTHATWFNMTGPAGDPAYDASIANEALYPDSTLGLFAEACVRLPADAFVYDPEFGPIRPPSATPAPCETAGFVTFGSLSQMYKIGAPCLDLWAAALRAAPTARFHLANASMAEPAARMRFAAEMEARGIASERLSTGVAKNWPGYLRDYARIDLALATFPVAGGTTMFEAVFQGVPMLSARGGHALARIGDWVAKAVDAPWMACATQDEFADRAAELAADPQRLIDARRNWRAALRAKSARDSKRVARALEAAFESLLRVEGAVA